MFSVSQKSVQFALFICLTLSVIAKHQIDRLTI